MRLAPGAVVQIVVYTIVLALAFSALDKRITTLEVQYDRVVQDLQEIKSDVKQLLARPTPQPLFKP